ncbi:hypothetical protein T492DRAFT_861267 [Pavlovales sp. CCMP2436]|nr:hypothetical protein T492DRAFT_861267 [Pavlovales sp. CCMP2436]
MAWATGSVREAAIVIELADWALVRQVITAAETAAVAAVAAAAVASTVGGAGTGVECYTHKDVSDYRGHLNSTSSGFACQTPHAHAYTPELHSAEGVGEHNYCRAVGSAWAWCFTTVDKPAWQYCRVSARKSACGP